MKLKIVILSALVVISTSNHNNTKIKKPPKNFNITNWEKYKLTEALQIKSLKKILESIAKFEKLDDCPLGPGKCQNRTVKYIMTKLIATAVEQEKDEVLKEEEKNITSQFSVKQHVKQSASSHSVPPTSEDWQSARDTSYDKKSHNSHHNFQ